MRRSNAIKAGVFLVLAAASGPSCVHEHRVAGEIPPTCRVTERSRRQARLDARRTIYVEPQALAASGGYTLLAGTPNYTWSAAAQGDSTRVDQDRVLGVILPDTGYARELRVPIDVNRIRSVRAVTQGDGSWAIVFVETPSPTRTDEVAHLWFGVHDGSDWKRLEHIPLPPDGRLRTGSVSSLARGGDVLVLAIPIRVAGGDDLAVFTYDGGRWTHQRVPTRRVAYAEPAFSAERGWMMAVVQPDTTVGSDGNSLFLYARDDGWRVIRKVDSGRSAPIHHPALRLDTRRGGALGWLAVVTSPDGAQRSEARVSSDPLNGPVLVARIDSTAENVLPTVLPDGRAVWLTDHHGAAGKLIRFFTEGPERMEEIGRVPNLFEGQFGAVALPGGDLLISGPLLELSGETLTSLTSQLVRVAVRCTPDTTRALRGAGSRPRDFPLLHEAAR